MIIKLKSKFFTFYDETDNLKRLKDSDLLAEKKRRTSNAGNTIRTGATGAVVGAGIGAGAGAIGAGILGAKALKAGGTNLAGVAKTARGATGKLAAVGALAGGLLSAGVAHAKSRGEMKENKAYNKRLEYAQRQALRRERKDWKTNMTQREGYSY